MSSSPSTPSICAKDAGVDIDAGDAGRAHRPARKTMREGVMAGIGGFGALFEGAQTLPEAVPVSGTDGVGNVSNWPEWKYHMHDTVGA